MLAKCADIPARRVIGQLEALPFPDHQFVLTTCTLYVEAVYHPFICLAKLARVTRPSGRISLVFCAERPVRPIWGHGLCLGVSV